MKKQNFLFGIIIFIALVGLIWMAITVDHYGKSQAYCKAIYGESYSRVYHPSYNGTCCAWKYIINNKTKTAEYGFGDCKE